ncbi:hypothetical protein J6590_102785 [Homalodisca vitripennis]|nr:hypothetical protein J6590_102785 [Homalodisca vitripennis]
MPKQAPPIANPANPAPNANVRAAQIVPANPAIPALLIDFSIEAVVERFTGKHSQQYHYSNLSNAVQQRNESVEAFADRVRQLGALTISHWQDPVEQRIVHEEAEMRMLHAFLHGLSGVTGQVPRHTFPESWDEAVRYAVMVSADERSQPTNESKPVFSTLITCFDCNRPGHMAHECRAPRHGHNALHGRGISSPNYNSNSFGRGQDVRGNSKNNSSFGRGRGNQDKSNAFQSKDKGNREDGRRTNVNVECYNCHDRGDYANQCSKLNPRSENRKGPVA